MYEGHNCGLLGPPTARYSVKRRTVLADGQCLEGLKAGSIDNGTPARGLAGADVLHLGLLLPSVEIDP
jgi:hypothetical protein